MTCEIRPYTAADAPGMVPLMADLGYPADAGEIAARLGRMPEETYLTLVALVDGTPAGFIGVAVMPVYEHPHPIGWILALAVRADFQRRGIGRGLIAAAEECLARRGVPDLRVHSGLQRSEAHRFYEALGYSKTGYRFRKALEFQVPDAPTP